MARVSGQGFEVAAIKLGGSLPASSLVDAEVFDDPDHVALLNAVVECCSACGSRVQAIVALVRIVSMGVEMAVCGECYRGLSERALGLVA